MTKDSRPEAESDGFAETELAATEHASGDVRSGSAPRGSGQARGDLRAVGRFRIDARLGAGGMGDVFRAYDPVLDRAVALKVLRPALVPDGAQRMRRVVREARAAAALMHPNTVTIFEVGEAEDEVFIAMELLEGVDLRTIIDRRSASLEEKLRWLLEAARALAAAHERGLVHRDVKPENMFIVKGGALKLLDFGIAKRDEDEGIDPAAPDDIGPSSLRTAEGRRLGTPRYMAPEQRAGEPTDARTDEYAWGLVAFELLTDTDGIADVPTVTKDVLLPTGEQKMTPACLLALRNEVPELPEPICAAIARALEPKKEDRFASMNEIVAALETKAETASGSKLPGIPPRPDAPPSDPAAANTTGSAGALTTLASAQTPVATPGRTPRSTAVVLITVATALVATFFIVRRAAQPSAAPAAPHERMLVAPALAPACRVESTHDVALGARDLLTVLSDRTVVVARIPDRKFAFERETPSGMVPFLRGGLFEAASADYESIAIGSIRYGGFPAVVVDLDQGVRGSYLGIWTDGHGIMSQRIAGASTGLATTTFDKDVVAISTTHEINFPSRVQPSLVEAYLLTGARGQHTTIEPIAAAAPAVATSKDRVAVAYATESGIHFALLDSEMNRIGDVQTVAPVDASPAVAFVGPTIVVFWTQDRGGKTRLMEASFTPGTAGFEPPKVAFEEAVAAFAPQTVALPNGAWGVSWIASNGGPAVLRVSPIEPHGSLTGPTDVATAPSIRGMRVMPTDTGAAFAWNATDITTRVAHVACKAP